MRFTKLTLFLIFIGLPVAYVAAGFLLYRIPEFEDVDISNYPKPAGQEYKTGTLYANALYVISQDMTNHWIVNDLFLFPTAYLDNPKNFELGELEAIRFATRVLRNNLSRLRSTEQIDRDVDQALVSFSNDPHELYWPRAEVKYENGYEALGRYLERLQRGDAGFYTSADNLNEFLLQFVSLLGDINERLAHAPRDQKSISHATIGEDKKIKVEWEEDAHFTPWLEIDNEFYYARGVLYVLHHLMIAVKQDFNRILTENDTNDLVNSIITTLDTTEITPLFVFNGDSDSFLANHSLNLQARVNKIWHELEVLRQITMM